MSDLREQILHAATEIFADHGYAGTSMRQVAEVVGCTKPALYYHFENKEDLFRETLRVHSAALTALTASVLESQGNLRQSMQAALRKFKIILQENPTGIRLLLTTLRCPPKSMPPTDLQQISEEHDRMLHQLVAAGIANGEIRSDISPELTVMSIVGLFTRLSELSVTRPFQTKATDEQLMDLLFHGIAP